MDDIFNKAKELVRNNWADFEEATQSITKKILLDKPPTIKRISCRFRVLLPRYVGKEVIVIAWLLSDIAIGKGRPSVPTALAQILTKRFNTGLNPANPQEWIRGDIFHEKESKERLEDAIRAYKTENPLKDESAAGTVAQEAPAEENGGQRNKLSKEAKVLAALTDNPELSDTDIAKKAGVSRTSLYRMKKYRQARDILKSSKADLPKGSKSKDGNIEAWD